MEHSFDVDIAKRYGIHAAILLKNIYFWIEKNRANDTNFYDGYYWTFNSKKAFAELFPYMNARQVDYALQKLIDDKLIITGNYNKVAYDRTLWYAITKKGYSILQNCEMESTKKENGNDNGVEPIPDSKPDCKPHRKPNKKKGKQTAKQFVPPTLEEVKAYCAERGNKVDAQFFFDFFDASGWIDSKGNPVRSWKQKILTWESHAKNRKGNTNTGTDTPNSAERKDDLDDIF